MNLSLEIIEGELSVALTGAMDSLVDPSADSAAPLWRVEELVRERRPRQVRLDLKGLASIDSGSFQRITELVSRLRRLLPVELVGPGPAVERLFSLLPPPSWWKWGRIEPLSDAGEDPRPRGAKADAGSGAAPAATGPERPGEGARRPPAEPVEAFEIDLDRELLLRKNEPAVPEYDPMAEPLDLFGGGKDLGGGIPEEKEEEAESARLDTPPAGTPGGPEWDLDWGVEPDPEGWDAELELDPEPVAGTAGEATGAGDREEVLKERLITAILSEDRLRARVRELLAERLWLRRKLSEAGAAGAREPARRQEDRGSRLPAIPSFLRADSSRLVLTRELTRLWEEKRRGKPVSRSAVTSAAAALARCVERAPFSSFDLGQARVSLPAPARAAHLVGLALCMSARAGASPTRLRALALSAVLWALDAAPSDRLEDALAVEDEARALARRIHRKLSAVEEGGPARGGLREAEVREQLWLLALVSAFWRRIGPGPAGGAEPAVAVAALGRGEIGRGVPTRFRRLFLLTFSAYPPGTWVRLESGEVGVVVAPGRDPRGPLVLSLFAGGEAELRARHPRLVESGLERGGAVRAVVGCPVPRCPLPRDRARTGTEVASD